jgi:hypothetical protein
MMTICYVFQPRQALLDVMANHQGVSYFELFTKGEVWTGEIGDFTLIEERQRVLMLAEAKFAFHTRFIPTKRATDIDLELMHTLFGNPSRYNLENFDRWWTLSILNPAFEISNYWKNNVSIEKVEKLEKTGDSDIDTWLDSLTRLTRENRQKRGVDSNTGKNE